MIDGHAASSVSPAKIASDGADRSVATEHDVLTSLPGRIEPTRVTWTYRLGLGLAAVVLVCLLAAYVALVVASSYGIWSHFASPGLVARVHEAIPQRANYYLVCVLGSILCLFLIKPILSALWPASPKVVLERAQSPLLFDFIERLCAAQGAATPRQIIVDLEINASAAFRPGALNLIGGHLVLTFGLPLVRGMNLSGFAGILAHELGHFRQGSAMRLTYLIRRTNRWLTRVVCERDGFDCFLVELAEMLPIATVQGFVVLIQVLVWLSRRLLWALLWISNLATAYLLRQMEYDADTHEARLVGSKVFAETGTMLLVLSRAAKAAFQDVEKLWNSRRVMVDDLPRLIAFHADRLRASPEVIERVRTAALRQGTGRFDDHPALRDRLAHVARENAPGLLHLEVPAAVLLPNIDELGKEVTRGFYRRRLKGDAEFLGVVVSCADLIGEQSGFTAAGEAVRRYCQWRAPRRYRISFSRSDHVPGCVEGGQAWANRLCEARNRMLDQLAEAIAAGDRYSAALERLDRADHDIALIEAREAPYTTEHGRLPASLEDAQAARVRALADRDVARGDLVPFINTVRTRMQTALRDVATQPIKAAEPERSSFTAERSHALASLLESLHRVWPEVEVLEDRCVLLGALAERYKQRRTSALFSKAWAIGNEIKSKIDSIKRLLAAVASPFEGSGGSRNLIGAQLQAAVPKNVSPDLAYQVAVELLTHLSTTHVRALSELTQAAEKVEIAAGLIPLPDMKAEAAGSSGSSWGPLATRLATPPQAIPVSTTGLL